MPNLLLTSLLALSFTAGLVGDADAARRKHKKRYYASPYGTSHAYGHRAQSAHGYYEQRLDVLAVGSQQWWAVYERQRGGRR
jgi:hypothetical protein